MEMSPAPTTNNEIKTCECGCGEQVSRRFRPGHDARLKSRLLTAAQDRRWWIRETAVHTLVELNWGHFLPAEILANTPVRSRHQGRFVETRHIHSLHGVVADEAGIDHSHWSCPKTNGKGVWVKEQNRDGWACGACIHTQDLSERVGRQRISELAEAA